MKGSPQVPGPQLVALPGKVVGLLGGGDLLEEGNCCGQALRVCFLRQDFKEPKPTLNPVCNWGRSWTSDPPISAGITGLWYHIHFVRCWWFYLGLCACQESTLPTEIHPQPQAWRSESLTSFMHALCFLLEDALRSNTSGSCCHVFPAPSNWEPSISSLLMSLLLMYLITTKREVTATFSQMSNRDNHISQMTVLG